MKQISLIFILLISAPSWAQTDPSAWISSDTLSAKDSGKNDVSTDGLDTQRYVKKPKHISKKLRSPANDDDLESNPQSPTASHGASDADLQNSQTPVLPRYQIGPQPDVQPITGDSQTAPPPTVNPNRPAPSFGRKMRDLILGGDLSYD